MQSAAEIRLKRDSTEHKRVDAVRTQLAAIVESSNDAIFSRCLSKGSQGQVFRYHKVSGILYLIMARP